MSDLAAEYREFQARGGYVDLSSRTHLLFTGADRLRYLNGQLTANLATAKAPCVRPACVTTAKGKLCADVFATIGPDAVMVDAEPSLAESLAARLEKYIVADAVELAALTDPVSHLHLVGVKAESLPLEIQKALSPAHRFGPDGLDTKLALTGGISSEDSQTAHTWLREHLPLLSPHLLEVLRIERGIPQWGVELDENTFPSEAGLDRTHVDYHKGCYIGQEVISRLRSVGHANRELRGFTAGAALIPGARLFTAEDPTRDLGRLTSATHSFALDRFIALGYLRRGAPESGLLAASAESPEAPVPVSLHPLPFVS